MGWGWPRGAKPYKPEDATKRSNDFVSQMRKDHEKLVAALDSIIAAVREIHHPYPQNTTGVDAYAKWYCRGCRQPWPCATWEATAPNYEFPTQLQLEWKRKP